MALVAPLLPAATFPAYVRKAAGSLMTRALLRPGGVEGVLQGVFGGTGSDQDSGKEESDTGKKSLSVAKVLGTVPGKMDAEVSGSSYVRLGWLAASDLAVFASDRNTTAS